MSSVQPATAYLIVWQDEVLYRTADQGMVLAYFRGLNQTDASLLRCRAVLPRQPGPDRTSITPPQSLIDRAAGTVATRDR